MKPLEISSTQDGSSSLFSFSLFTLQTITSANHCKWRAGVRRESLASLLCSNLSPSLSPPPPPPIYLSLIPAQTLRRCALPEQLSWERWIQMSPYFSCPPARCPLWSQYKYNNRLFRVQECLICFWLRPKMFFSLVSKRVCSSLLEEPEVTAPTQSSRDCIKNFTRTNTKLFSKSINNGKKKVQKRFCSRKTV